MLCAQIQSLLPQSRVDYRRLCRSARAGSIYELIADLRLELPAQWQRVYTAAASHTPNIIHVEHGTFDYICDSYSGMEALGEVAIDQRVRDRVVGVLGISLPMRGRRRGSLPKDWVEHPEECDSSGRDKGHYIAHAIGGGLDMNVFSQARPVYDDATSIPRWVEFGLLRDDGSLWVEVFEN